MSKNFKNPQAILHNVQPGEQVELDEFNLTPGAYPGNGNGSLHVVYPTNGNGARPKAYPGNGNGSLHGVYPTNGNGSQQYSASAAPFLTIPTMPLLGVKSSGIDPYNGVETAQFKVHATPSHNGMATPSNGVAATSFPNIQPAISVKCISELKDPHSMSVDGLSTHKQRINLFRPYFDDVATLYTPAVRLANEHPVDFTPRMGKLLYIYLICLSLDLLFIGTSPHLWLNWYLTIIWSFYIPLTVIGVLGALASRDQHIKPYVGTRQERVIFLIPTVARNDTLPGLRRVIDSILICASHHLPNYEIHVLLEEDAEGVEEIQRHYRFHDRVLCIVIPGNYTPKNGTCYKARANQFALEYRRRVGLNGSDVFIYHGDDDTSVGHDTVWSIAYFIEKNTHDLAQGLLTYPHQLSRSWFCRLADSIRPADDMSRFYFCTGKLGTPLAGLHGEHLLIRASVEDEIGWDFGPSVKVEDAYFGLLFAARFPGRSTFLPSCSYGASPSSIRDLIRQRRRWAAGLLGLLVDRQVPWKIKPVLYYSIANWTFGIFQHVVIILIIAGLLHSPDTSPIFPCIIAIWCANFAFQIWMYLEGLRINLEASQARHIRFYLLPLVLIPAIPFISFVEASSALLGLFDFLRRKQGFDVISKRH